MKGIRNTSLQLQEEHKKYLLYNFMKGIINTFFTTSRRA
jgi:hypothetical protein